MGALMTALANTLPADITISNQAPSNPTTVNTVTWMLIQDLLTTPYAVIFTYMLLKNL
jgi:hypothetical protein